MMKKKETLKCNMRAENKGFDISRVNLDEMGDLRYILDGLMKSKLIEEAFEEFSRNNVNIPQICAMLFRSDKEDFNPKYINMVLITYFVNPENLYNKRPVFIEKDPTTITEFIVDDIEDPLKIDYLEQDIDNIIYLVFTDLKNRIEVDLVPLKCINHTTFDFINMIRFFSMTSPYEEGYLPHVYKRNEVGNICSVKNF